MILFQNENFIAFDKPAGYTTVPTRLADRDPRPCLGTYWQQQLGIQLYPIHRLDLDVSGLVLFAKNPLAHKAGCLAFDHRTVSKSYQAITLAADLARSELQELPIGQSKVWKSKISKGKKRAYRDEQRGRLAITKIQLQKVDSNFAYWQVMPETGRSHQIRFHFYEHGMPIVGDFLYNSAVLWQKQSEGIALRSVGLDFSKCEDVLKLGMPAQLVASNLEGCG